MKPRVTLEQARLENGSTVALNEHDGRLYVTVDGEQTSGPMTRHNETAMAAMACEPFRPVRQPTIWMAGLGTGAMLAGVRQTLLQKRATLYVAEPCGDLRKWLLTHLPEPDTLLDPCLKMETNPGADGLMAHADELHAILMHTDTAPLLDRSRQLFEDRKWLAAAYNSLMTGGLIAIGSSRPVPGLEEKLRRAGFNTAIHEIDALPNSKKPKKSFLLLGRKGKYSS